MTDIARRSAHQPSERSITSEMMSDGFYDAAIFVFVKLTLRTATAAAEAHTHRPRFYL